MHLKRAWQSPACSQRCTVGAVGRWSKPLVLAAAVAAFSLFYSCKKFDPHEHLSRKPVPEDTATFGKKKFIDIGKRTFTDEKPVADTILALPLKPKALVSAEN